MLVCINQLLLIQHKQLIMKQANTGKKVQGILFNQSSVWTVSILGLHRTPIEGNFWQPLTGTVEENESYEDCLIREINEETGIVLNDIIRHFGPIYVFTWTRDSVMYTEKVYAVEIKPDTAVLISEEHDEFKWLSVQEATNLFKFQNIKDCVTLLNERLTEK